MPTTEARSTHLWMIFVPIAHPLGPRHRRRPPQTPSPECESASSVDATMEKIDADALATHRGEPRLATASTASRRRAKSMAASTCPTTSACVVFIYDVSYTVYIRAISCDTSTSTVLCVLSFVHRWISVDVRRIYRTVGDLGRPVCVIYRTFGTYCDRRENHVVTRGGVRGRRREVLGSRAPRDPHHAPRHASRVRS